MLTRSYTRNPSAIFATIESLNDDVGATELCKELLRFVARESSRFRRNRYRIAEIFSYLHTVYCSIRDLVEAVESLQTLDWTSFDKYTRAITDLERALIDFRLSTYKGCYGHTPMLSLADTEADLVRFIAAWEQNRKDLDEFATTISDLALDSERLTALQGGNKGYATDDLDTGKAIGRWLSTNVLTDDHLSKRPLQSVRKTKESLLKTLDAMYSRPPTNQELRALFMKFLFLALVPFSVLTIENGLSSDDTLIFRKSATWHSMFEHVSNLNDFIVNPQHPVPGAVLEAYEALWSLFFTGGGLVDLSGDLRSLMEFMPNN